MMASGTAVFTDPDDYRAGMGDAGVDLILTEPGDFSARLTWLKLGYFHAFRGRESTPRIAHMSLVPNRLFVSFPLTSSFVLVWNGVELQLGDIVIHSRGESGHQWTNGTSQWALVSFPADQLADYCRALAEFDLPNRPAGQILRLPPSVAMRLRRLHSKVCHLVETKPEIFIHQEAARAVEQEFILALVECLAIAGTGQAPIIRQHHADIMRRFENALRMDSGKPPNLSELCAIIDVPERTLRDCCVKFLGVSPGRYIRLRRLNFVRAELRRADPATTSVAQIARRHRFSELGRFAAVYRRIFGEFPSVTLTSK
jgi:AraC-like DNA-binding protein